MTIGRRPGRCMLLAALTVAALMLTACGGSGEDPEGTSSPATGTAEGDRAPEGPDGGAGEGEDAPPAGPGDEQQIEAAIESLLIDPDNEFVCNDVLTQKLLETAYGDLQGCLDGRAPATLARSIKRISRLQVTADGARAEAVPAGGLYDGEVLEIEAVDDGDGWRIDQFIADIPVGP